MPERAHKDPPSWDKLSSQEREALHNLRDSLDDSKEREVLYSLSVEECNTLVEIVEIDVSQAKQLLARRCKQDAQRNVEHDTATKSSSEPPSHVPEINQKRMNRVVRSRNYENNEQRIKQSKREAGTKQIANKRKMKAMTKGTNIKRRKRQANDHNPLEEAKTTPEILQALAHTLRATRSGGQKHIPTEEVLARWISPQKSPLCELDAAVLPRLHILEAVLPTPFKADGEWAFIAWWPNKDKCEFRIRYRDPVCLETMCYYEERTEDIAQIFIENREDKIEAARRMGYNSLGIRFVNKRGEWLPLILDPESSLTEIPNRHDEHYRHDEHFTINHLHALWLSLPKHLRPSHPLEPLIAAWQETFRTTDIKFLVVPGVLKNSRPLNRVPAYATISSLSVVEAVNIDDIPTASKLPLDYTQTAQGYRLAQRIEQGQLFPGPKTINGEAIQNAIITAPDDMPLMGDIRRVTLVRADVARIVMLAYALEGEAYFNEEEGALFLTGRINKTSKKRWHEALRWADSLRITIDASTGRWYKLVDASPNPRTGVSKIAAPWWWREEGLSGGKQTGGFRLSGGLWRPALLGDQQKQGTSSGYWGGTHRTLDGLEAALTWSKSAGRGQGGRLPAALIPVHKGGPGPEWFVPWDWVLICSGERIPSNASSKGSEARRYRDRVSSLESAGYMVVGNTAPANDTIEIVRIQKGNRCTEAGIVIRATARFCAAYTEAQKKSQWRLLPASHLFS